MCAVEARRVGVRRSRRGDQRESIEVAHHQVEQHDGRLHLQGRIERRRGMAAVVIGDVRVGREHAPHRFADERLVIDEQHDRHGSMADHMRCRTESAERLPKRRDYNRITERRTTDVERLLPNRPPF